MIHHLRGRLIEKNPTHVVIECSGVGYLVSISLTTFESIPDKEDIFLHIHMVVRRRFADFIWICYRSRAQDVLTSNRCKWSRGKYR